ncbi:unnamed protein product, partial [Ectocarpus sp. 12 AP-2014]
YGDRSGNNTTNNNNNNSSSEEWKLSYSVAPGEMRSVAMPEPQHRIGPAGVSSGVSLRSLPPARLEDLTKICQHYEEKCSGVYASDSAAARYLFQLSREVQQVAAALEQERSSQTLGNLQAEQLLKEWNESFGPDAPLLRDAASLGVPLSVGFVGSETGDGGAGETKGDNDASGDGNTSGGGAGGDAEGLRGGVSPGKVAEALRQLAKRAEDAERGSDEATKDRAASVAGLRGALDAHVAVSAESSAADRHMHQQERAALIDQQEKFVRDLREQHDQTIQQILTEKDVENSKCTESFKKQLNEVQLELLNNRQHMINTEAQWRKRLEEQEQRESGEMMRMREAFQGELASVKSDLSTAHAAIGGLGAMGMADGRRGGAVGTVTGGGGGGAGMPPGLDGVDSSDSADHKVRSLSLLVEEAKKESRWLRERNQELERVVEALRKTIMRQAELSSQRQDQQG